MNKKKILIAVGSSEADNYLRGHKHTRSDSFGLYFLKLCT